MTLRIYNTLTRTKEEFKPLDPQNVRMYVCGPTVYDYAHIGNARPAIVFDVLFRLLRHLYGESHVTYVRNITDVDDKINARALRDYPGMPLNDAIRRVTETTYEQYQKDVTALGCLPPTMQPRATEHIQGMINMISTLIKRGHAYEAAGEVLFDVGSMPDYGRLSQRKLEEQQAGARIAVEAHKINPADFVLWKQSSPEEPGWESPWGRGRPGWHIECSVMSKAHLGEVFDIHGGGLDLIFPHHENEIAQSCCAHGTPVMANYWMHNGFLQVEGQKMSKSLGNFTTIADVLKDWPGEVARFNMLRTHYRQPIDWRASALEESKAILANWIASLRNAALSFTEQNIQYYREYQVPPAVIDALSDDLNISEAISAMHGFAKGRDPLDGHRLMASMLMLGITDFDQLRAQLKFDESQMDSGLPRERIVRLVEDRLLARHQKNWAESDRIRDELAAMGIAIKDNKDGTTSWEIKR